MPKTTSQWLKTIGLCGLFALFLQSCGGQAPEISAELGRESGMRVGGVAVGPWWVTMAERGGQGEVAHIYIEGDGRAFLTSSMPSANPTPKKPWGLWLAHADDPSVPTFYLARPCQYAKLTTQPCTPEVWTVNRFDETVMDGYAQAVRRLLEGAPLPAAGSSSKAAMENGQVAAKRAVVIGYSGGAVIALELAKRLPQVVGVITVAGNIDPAATNAWHHASPMPTAISPYQYPGRLADIPVLHVVGGQDKVIPPELTRQVLDKAGKLACTEVYTVPDAEHDEGWDKKWYYGLGKQKIWPPQLPRCN